MAIVAALNRLSFVRWDRMVRGSGEGAPDTWYADVYGWIDRADDGRADFVLVQFASWLPQPYVVTSSATRSRDLALALYGDEDGHVLCERVEDVFPGGVPSAIRLA